MEFWILVVDDEHIKSEEFVLVRARYIHKSCLLLVDNVEVSTLKS